LSVICGFLSFSSDKSPEIFGKQMISALKSIPADRVEDIHTDRIFLSCHHQYVTPEAVNELLPYHDSEADIYLVANAIIDNRKELLNTFDIPTGEWDKYTDSQLILLSYKKWGNDCVKHLLGDYSFAVYDKRADELFCARDHMGRSTFYYTINDDYFAFCTIMKPLVSINKEKGLNEQWIADFLAVPTVIGELDTSLTAYKEIMQLPPAHILVLRDKKAKTSKYWDPVGVKKIRYKNDSDYDEAFREVLTESVRCKLRNIGNIGIMLSGGFDSSTVACIAAGLLEQEGKELRSYTSIPMEGYIEIYGKNYMADESPFVKEILNMYPNIVATFWRSEGKNSFIDTDKYIDMFEQPFKVVENNFWHADIYEKARQDNCKVMLNGQFGNINISHSDFFINFHTLLCSGKLIKLYKEIQAYSRNYNIGRKKTIIKILYGLMPFLDTNAEDRYSRSFPLINPEFAEKYNVKKRLDKLRYDAHKNYGAMTLRKYRQYVFKHPMISQIAAFENKLSIYNGLVTRDPTKDIRLIEFCFGLPADQYIKNGRNRVILRRSMKGILPEKIRLNYTKKGVQAADWIQKLLPLWDDIRVQIIESLENDRVQKYLNTNDILSFLDENKELSLSINSIDLRQAIAAYIFSKFLQKSETMI